MMFKHAILRRPGKNFANGITSSIAGKPDYARMLTQHDKYRAALDSLGLKTEVLEPLEDHPDSYFVEDVAVITNEIAIITNPGASPRRNEAVYIEPTLKKYREIRRILSPGTMDGGDILHCDNHFFIGISDRTNDEGAEQFITHLQKFGYTFNKIKVAEGLHLKSGVNFVGHDTLVLAGLYQKEPAFAHYNKIIIEKSEEYACNTLLVNNHLIIPKGFPRTKEKLKSLNIQIIELDTSEARKMDGGLTCMSLRF